MEAHPLILCPRTFWSSANLCLPLPFKVPAVTKSNLFDKQLRNEQKHRPRKCIFVRANLGIGENTVLTSIPSKVQSAKESLLDAISGVKGRGREASQKQQTEIIDAVKVLEENGGVPDPTSTDLIEGKWQLMYTTRPGTASPIQRTFVGVDAFSVFQQISLRNTESPRVTNTVNFSESIGELRVEAEASIQSGKRINFRFDKAAFYLKFWPYRLPYPVPFRLLGDEAKGWLETTYLALSGDLRISKGNKGTTFVLQKNPGPRQRLLLAIKSGRDVEKVIHEIVALSPSKSPAKSSQLQGKWRLVWSSQADGANWLQQVASKFSSNWQIIDQESNRLYNVVELIPGLKLRAGADTSTLTEARTNVKINSAAVEVGNVKIPLSIAGDGWIEQLYLDQKLRISKGNKGSTFIHVRED